MAPRRGLHPDQLQNPLPMARGRPARQRTRHPGPTSPGCPGRQEVLPPTAQGLAVCAAGAGDRQARQLRGRPPRGDAVGGPSPVEVPEQSRRELPSAHPATRAVDETLQISQACPTVPVCVQRHFATFPGPTTTGAAQKTILSSSFSNLDSLGQARTQRLAQAQTDDGPPWSLWTVIWLTSGLLLACAIIYDVKKPATHYTMVA